MSHSFDPDQGQHFVGPDLGPNFLQKFSTEYIVKLVSGIEKCPSGKTGYLAGF